MSTSSASTRPDHPLLTLDQIGTANRASQRDGTFAGLASGLIAAIISSRFLRFNRNLTLLSGLLTGAASGYFWTQAFLQTNLAAMSNEARSAILARESEQDFEGGSGGQQGLRDRYATTRGDH